MGGTFIPDHTHVYVTIDGSEIRLNTADVRNWNGQYQDSSGW